MPEEDIVIGGLYAHNYLRTDEILRDNPRMRFRLGKLFETVASHQHSDAYDFGNLVERELGFSVLRSGYSSSYFPYGDVTETVKIVDLLHIVTLLFKFLGASRHSNNPNRLRSQIQRIFDETNVGYKLDEKGGVHPKMDEEFERVRVSAIRKLGSPEFATERYYVEAVEQALLADPLDGKAAIRSTFDAIENLYKQIFPKAPQMNKANLQNHLKSAMELLFPGAENKNARRSSLKLVEALIDWVDGVHEYRHAPGTPEPLQPPEELTILVVSQGLAYLRWLAELRQPIDKLSKGLLMTGLNPTTD